MTAINLTPEQKTQLTVAVQAAVQATVAQWNAMQAVESELTAIVGHQAEVDDEYILNLAIAANADGNVTVPDRIIAALVNRAQRER